MSRDAILFAIMCAIGALGYYIGRLTAIEKLDVVIETQFNEIDATLREVEHLREILYLTRDSAGIRKGHE